MAKISVPSLIQKLKEIHGKPNAYADLREWFLSVKPESAKAEGNGHVDRALPIALDGARRKLVADFAVNMTPESATAEEKAEAKSNAEKAIDATGLFKLDGRPAWSNGRNKVDLVSLVADFLPKPKKAGK